MQDRDPSQAVPSVTTWQSMLVMVAGGILAVIVWTIPNWAMFWGHLSQFPALWQLPENRRTIIALFIKILAPIPIMGILGIGTWIVSLMQMPQETKAEREQTRFTAPALAQSEPRITSATALMPTQQRPPQSYTSAQLSLPRSSLTPAKRVPDPVTPLPPVLLEPGAFHQQEQAQEHPEASFQSAEQEPPPVREDAPASSTVSAGEVAPPLILSSSWEAASHPLISIRLLKDVSMTINVPGGGHVVVPLSLPAKRVQLLAYIAWRRGELIDRDKILEHVFGWGLSDEEATQDKLSERFESHKKLLRKKIKEVVAEQINKPAGMQLLDPDQVDVFTNDAGFWGLSHLCRVEDLEVIQACHKVIALARKDGKLAEQVPDYVKQACDELIAGYPGDFLESLIKKYPGEFNAWQGRSSWVKKPFTLFRDYYLDALWYSAEYEWRLGQHAAEGTGAEGEQRQQVLHYGRAAQLYQTYAMYACNTKFDAKVTFGAHGEYGERVGMSERALRRCVMLLGALGKTDLVNQVWSAYSSQMKRLSDHRWEPSHETKTEVNTARAQTKAHRFSAQISQMSNDLVGRQGRPAQDQLS